LRWFWALGFILFGLAVSCADGDATDGNEGTLGAPCYPNDTCNQGLSCEEGVCLSVSAPDAGATDTAPVKVDTGGTKADAFVDGAGA